MLVVLKRINFSSLPWKLNFVLRIILVVFTKLEHTCLEGYNYYHIL